MLATFIIVGTVVTIPENTEEEGTGRHPSIIVETENPFRNEDGTLTKNTFHVQLWKGIAQEVHSACRKGSVIVIRGRMKSDESGQCRLVAEKVSYLHNRR